uniref:Uncharacterized protein n=1 Tax=viral metagenome TaxID=1070528 RepID=A0A6C0I757_9ZZZZ
MKKTEKLWLSCVMFCKVFSLRNVLRNVLKRGDTIDLV